MGVTFGAEDGVQGPCGVQIGADRLLAERLHPIHQDSTQVQQALYEAAQRDLISLDNPEFQKVRLKIAPGEAQQYLDGLPGEPAMYRRLAERLMAYLDEVVETLLDYLLDEASYRGAGRLFLP